MLRIIIIAMCWTVSLVISAALPEIDGSSDRMSFDPSKSSVGRGKITRTDSVVRLIPPKDSWQMFVRHDETQRARNRKKVRNRKRKNMLKSFEAGPPGPRGPAGPRGAPGAEISQEVLINEFRKMVKEAAERRVQTHIDAECTDCQPDQLENITGPYIPPLFDIREANVVSKIIAGFHARLSNKFHINRKMFLELRSFEIPFATGAFNRGSNYERGRFNVTRSGIYHLVANVQMRIGKRSARMNNMVRSSPLEDTVSVLICIQSVCHGNNLSLESTITVSQRGGIFTLLVNGHLELQKGQYVSVFVDNGASVSLTALPGSYFSGILVGI